MMIIRTLVATVASTWLFLATTALGAAPAPAVPNDDCLLCHTDPETKRTVAGQKQPIQLMDTNRFQESVHGKLNCVDCHQGIKEADHAPKLPPAQCTTCHESKPSHLNALTNYQNSIHGMSHKMGASAAAGCADCHGSHYIEKVKSADSPVFKLNLNLTCAKCHSNPGLTKEYKMKYPEVATQYQDSIHGRALLKMGLIVAPSCNDCHGVHDIKRIVDRDAPINRANINKTCGKCHVGIEKIFNKSIHGQMLAKGSKDSPVCTDCHNAHQIESPSNGHFKLVSDAKCGKCHKDRLEHYRETYHGKALSLGKPNVAPDVAACYDCHGHHDVLPAAHPNSYLSKSNIVATCQKCHPGINAAFTKYQPHANPMDRANYPWLNTTFVLMTTLLICVFTFFGGHTLLWLFRSIYLFFHDSKKFREAKIDAQAGDEWFTRFQPFERFLHFLVVTSFLLLTVTGMPLKFYYTDWARALFQIMGGADVARSLHHFGALITFLYFALHISSLTSTAWNRRGDFKNPATGRLDLKRIWNILFGPDSMVPTVQDWREFIAHQKWFFGKGQKPQFDRWTYWEKFDYFAVFWGVFAIGVSGLVMWFPKFFTLFMPGWIINIALVVHSDEALLAAGFIFTIHFFNTHFRLEKFPMDTVIFSGRISKTEMLHERKRWYDRLKAEGRLDDFRIKDEWEQWKSIARSMGYLFFGVGVILLVLIVYAMITRLFH